VDPPPTSTSTQQAQGGDAFLARRLPLRHRPHQRLGDRREAVREVNWASHVDIKTGRPIETEVSKRVRAGEQIELWPGQWAARTGAHAAFNPETRIALRQHHSNNFRG